MASEAGAAGGSVPSGANPSSGANEGKVEAEAVFGAVTASALQEVPPFKKSEAEFISPLRAIFNEDDLRHFKSSQVCVADSIPLLSLASRFTSVLFVL